MIGTGDLDTTAPHRGYDIAEYDAGPPLVVAPANILSLELCASKLISEIFFGANRLLGKS